MGAAHGRLVLHPLAWAGAGQLDQRERGAADGGDGLQGEMDGGGFASGDFTWIKHFGSMWSAAVLRQLTLAWFCACCGSGGCSEVPMGNSKRGLEGGEQSTSQC